MEMNKTQQVLRKSIEKCGHDALLKMHEEAQNCKAAFARRNDSEAVANFEEYIAVIKERMNELAKL